GQRNLKGVERDRPNGGGLGLGKGEKKSIIGKLWSGSVGECGRGVGWGGRGGRLEWFEWEEKFKSPVIFEGGGFCVCVFESL
ncbi:hypothetical protein, partial [Neisseria sicca]|uniref:hypothetical protein n=1 Tax=Neisseria sicca TaxID=490 RepID=UPI001C991C7A